MHCRRGARLDACSGAGELLSSKLGAKGFENGFLTHREILANYLEFLIQERQISSGSASYIQALIPLVKYVGLEREAIWVCVGHQCHDGSYNFDLPLTVSD